MKPIIIVLTSHIVLALVLVQYEHTIMAYLRSRILILICATDEKATLLHAELESRISIPTARYRNGIGIEIRRMSISHNVAGIFQTDDFYWYISLFRRLECRMASLKELQSTSATLYRDGHMTDLFYSQGSVGALAVGESPGTGQGENHGSGHLGISPQKCYTDCREPRFASTCPTLPLCSPNKGIGN